MQPQQQFLERERAISLGGAEQRWRHADATRSTSWGLRSRERVCPDAHGSVANDPQAEIASWHAKCPRPIRRRCSVYWRYACTLDCAQHRRLSRQCSGFACDPRCVIAEDPTRALLSDTAVS